MATLATREANANRLRRAALAYRNPTAESVWTIGERWGMTPIMFRARGVRAPGTSPNHPAPEPRFSGSAALAALPIWLMGSWRVRDKIIIAIRSVRPCGRTFSHLSQLEESPFGNQRSPLSFKLFCGVEIVRSHVSPVAEQGKRE